MFCTKCGSEIKPGNKFCVKCGTPVYAFEQEPQASQPPVTFEKPPKSRRRVLLPVILILLILLVIGAAGVAGYAVIKTDDFDDVVAEFESMPDNYAGLGTYESEYTGLLENAQSAAAHFSFWKFEELTSEMDSLTRTVDQMNEKVAEYQEEYDSIVQEIEVDGKYIMDDYEEDYQAAKTELETALAAFDEEECKKTAEAFADVRDDIIAGNKEKAEEYVKAVNDIQSSFVGYDMHSFEEYVITELTVEIEEDKDTADYRELYSDYQMLSDWADKFKAAGASREQVERYVQADVSESDKVKLYLSAYGQDTYNFKLEDFIIYEYYNEVWTECMAEDISQIGGMLSMDIVADISTSMWDSFYDMQCAIDAFVGETYTDTALGLSIISSIYERRQTFTTDKNQITNAVWNLECEGVTSLYQSLYSSVVYTASAEGARCVVAFTDGMNVPYGVGYDYDAQDVIDVSLYYQVPVYIIGIGSSVDSGTLRNIAESTGGVYYANKSVNDLAEVYRDIYEAQGKMYQLSYSTTVPNSANRDIYVLYADETQNLGIRFEEELNAEALQIAYESAGLTADDLAGYYTDSKYLSSDDLARLGDDLEAVQTIINIYYAKNGYQFADSDNGKKQLEKMKNLGIITENGTLDGDTVTEILRSDPIIWQNFSALYNYRYELIYTVAYDIYINNPYISYEELRSLINQHYGEQNETRFDSVISAVWKNIQAG